MRYGLSVRAERFAYRMTGVEGWQRIPGSPLFRVDALSGRLVLTYELTRVMPRFFADVRLAEGRIADWNATLSAAAELAYLRTKGTMDQHFYGDDPGTPDQDETGRDIKNVVNRIIGLAGGVSAGYRFLF